MMFISSHAGKILICKKLLYLDFDETSQHYFYFLQHKYKKQKNTANIIYMKNMA